jgi:hypothetical protein
MTAGTGTGTTSTFTIPFTAAYTALYPAIVVDNGTTVWGRCTTTAGSNIMSVHTTPGGGSFTNATSRGYFIGSITIESQ